MANFQQWGVRGWGGGGGLISTTLLALAWVGGDVRGKVWFGSFIQRLIVL